MAKFNGYCQSYLSQYDYDKCNSYCIPSVLYGNNITYDDFILKASLSCQTKNWLQIVSDNHFQTRVHYEEHINFSILCSRVHVRSDIRLGIFNKTHSYKLQISFYHEWLWVFIWILSLQGFHLSYLAHSLSPISKKMFPLVILVNGDLP